MLPQTQLCVVSITSYIGVSFFHNMVEASEPHSSLRLLSSKVSATIGTWVVRICNPYVEEWTMTTRRGAVQASKLVARLVAENPSEYCLGIVPFDFQDPTGAAKAKIKFSADSVWKIEKVTLINGNDLQFSGCTVNVIVDLKHSTTTKSLGSYQVSNAKSTHF